MRNCFRSASSSLLPTWRKTAIHATPSSDFQSSSFHSSALQGQFVLAPLSLANQHCFNTQDIDHQPSTALYRFQPSSTSPTSFPLYTYPSLSFSASSLLTASFVTQEPLNHALGYTYPEWLPLGERTIHSAIQKNMSVGLWHVLPTAEQQPQQSAAALDHRQVFHEELSPVHSCKASFIASSPSSITSAASSPITVRLVGVILMEDTRQPIVDSDHFFFDTPKLSPLLQLLGDYEKIYHNYLRHTLASSIDSFTLPRLACGALGAIHPSYRSSGLFSLLLEYAVRFSIYRIPDVERVYAVATSRDSANSCYNLGFHEITPEKVQQAILNSALKNSSSSSSSSPSSSSSSSTSSSAVPALEEMSYTTFTYEGVQPFKDMKKIAKIDRPSLVERLITTTLDNSQIGRLLPKQVNFENPLVFQYTDLMKRSK